MCGVHLQPELWYKTNLTLIKLRRGENDANSWLPAGGLYKHLIWSRDEDFLIQTHSHFGQIPKNFL